jgi:hypothetical protein
MVGGPGVAGSGAHLSAFLDTARDATVKRYPSVISDASAVNGVGSGFRARARVSAA